MLSYDESLKILKETNALLEGHFILSSGLHSDKYIQCAKLLSHTKEAQMICSSLCEKIKNNFKEIDLILTPAIGGIVVGFEIGRQLNIETIFAERIDKELLLRRGFNISQNSKVLIVEGAVTVGYSCIIDRSNNKSKITDKIISQVKIDIETYESSNLPDKIKKIDPIKPGSRNLQK